MKADIQGEKQWHNELYSRNQASLDIPRSVLDRYLRPSRKALFKLERLFEIVGDVRGKNVLMYGCGDGFLPALFAMKGAKVWGIDISDVAIERQIQRAAKLNFNGNLRFSVGSVEELPYESGLFDLVLGLYILHHLPDALASACAELRRVLKPSGTAIFIEPVARNRAFSVIRRFFPETDISPRERMLSDADFTSFYDAFDVREENFDFLGNLNKYVLQDDYETAGPLRRSVAWLLVKADSVIFKVKGSRVLARYSMLIMDSPKQTTEAKVGPRV
jgi:SAM-dependent methyltransferase